MLGYLENSLKCLIVFFVAIHAKDCYKDCQLKCHEDWLRWEEDKRILENWIGCHDDCIPKCQNNEDFQKPYPSKDATDGPNRASTAISTKKPYTEDYATEATEQLPRDPEDRLAIFDKFKKQLMDCHNERRKAHGVPLLVHSEDLAREAQQYAEKLAKENSFKHETGLIEKNIGENLHYAVHFSRGSKIDYSTIDSEYGLHTCRDWYCEINDYDYSTKKSKGGMINHFLQVVWKATDKAGFGIAVAPKRGGNPKDEYFVIVGRYTPKGPIIGQFDANVPKPKESTQKYCENY